MNYKIVVKTGQEGWVVGGVWSASNAHTALSRALTGILPTAKAGIAHVGPRNDRMEIGEELNISLERI